MLKNSVILFAFTLGLLGEGNSQNVTDTIRKIAIEIKNPCHLSEELFQIFSGYKFICLGELHGTREPAEFLTGLVRSFTSHHNKVVVGFEIPGSKMRAFREQADSIGLRHSEFFSDGPGDGRNSTAWFEAILACKAENVRFCFFDSGDNDRDRGMYKNLMDCFQTDSSAVFITLSGNIHNKIVPYNEQKTMGYYLKSRFKNNMFSINHIHNGGSMFAKTSEGLKIHTLERGNSVFATSTGFQNYFIKNIFTLNDYSGFYFTRTVTASLPVTR